MTAIKNFDEDRDYDAVQGCPDCGWCDECARNHHDPCGREDVW